MVEGEGQARSAIFPVTISAFRYPQLVRVVWIDPVTRKKRSFSPSVVARDSDHAFDVCDAVLTCMVPMGRKLRIGYQTAVLDRPARAADVFDRATEWVTFCKFWVGKERELEDVA